MHRRTSSDGATTVSNPRWLHALLWVGFPLWGAAVGWVLASASDWIVGLPWIPFQGPFELVSSITGPFATVALLALGIVAGIVLALTAYGEMLTVEVSAQCVVRGLDA